MQTYDVQASMGIPQDPRFMTQEGRSGFGEYNREVMDSDDEDDLSKMDMGGRAKGVYIGGTLKHRGNGQHITSRRKQCKS
ncbi:hypothetical protein CK203_058079 [Vitis vinifera]|uniref:Uncharacterized protein n=1 Tax=Vitis vinifera TaxID=29760 RepID=A0A438GGS4_VITVI|nr:hypothetical protein CK203_058079 [Vitis vinifera]